METMRSNCVVRDGRLHVALDEVERGGGETQRAQQDDGHHANGQPGPEPKAADARDGGTHDGFGEPEARRVRSRRVVLLLAGPGLNLPSASESA